MNRRAVIKMLAHSAALIGAGVLMPAMAVAAWNKRAFDANSQFVAVRTLLGAEPLATDLVVLKVPSIAADGSVVPVSVKTSLASVESISLFVEGNLHPLVAEFIIPEGTEAAVSTRIRMHKSSTITAVVKAGGQLWSASQDTKVTIGGCDG
ncbi:thiosulfate oxidation carrier protein SoxY [uncultured Amphritea sp.]|uniref:thiosulfate oxidation carrier protein SoxY n=1 Tax=uncultured Amphritea sp. TaxID=981605 RepID=UPI002617DE9B|nr:thiosulfate oxidation carrier protein SoxY [uncultured Amphritea sp.]